MIDLAQLDFEREGGFVTVIAQDDRTGAVLMVARANREALERTLASGEMHYFSRRRGLWHKGATSGNVQRVVSLTPDCDGDVVLARVVPAGPACHTGSVSCFGDTGAFGDVLGVLEQRIVERQSSGSDKPSYTRRLLGDRNLRLKKLTEEAGELVVACADENGDQAVEEAADLLYHTAVALRAVDRRWKDVQIVLAERLGAR